jgi:tetratricopeptide (TPR) repeat protein
MGMFHRIAWPFLVPLVAAQTLSQAPPAPGPNELIQGYWEAHRDGRFADAAALREQARAFLDSVPVDEPQFGNWVTTVAQLYAGTSRSAQARSLLEAALARTQALGDTNPVRLTILNALADSWQQDGNLLKAVAYVEKVAAASPGTAGVTRTSAAIGRGMVISRPIDAIGVVSGQFQNYSFAYQRLAYLYRQLGRPQDAAAVLAKMADGLQANPMQLASFYEQQGKLDEAAALFQKEAETVPAESFGAYQSLARVYESQSRFGDAVAAIEKAQTAATDNPNVQFQTTYLRLNEARLLQRAGKTQAADSLYQNLLANAGSNSQINQTVNILNSYAQFLQSIQQGAKAEKMLTDYLNTHADLQPWESSNLLFQLSNLARGAGRTDQANEYMRAAQEKQRNNSQPLPEQEAGQKLTAAETAAAEGRADDAVQLVAEALGAPNNDQAFWQVQSIAGRLTEKSPGAAEEVFKRALNEAMNRSTDSLQPLTTASYSYANFLLGQQRWPEAANAIENLRSTLVEAHGAASESLSQVYQLNIQMATLRGSTADAVAAAREWAKFEASLSSNNSELYLRANDRLAETLEQNGDSAEAIDLRRKSVTIVDQVQPEDFMRRGQERSQLAYALVHLGQFDDAEQVAKEAIAIASHMTNADPNPFAGLLAMVQQSRANAQKPAAQTPSPFAQPVQALPSGGSHWFSGSVVIGPQPPPPLKTGK